MLGNPFDLFKFCSKFSILNVFLDCNTSLGPTIVKVHEQEWISFNPKKIVSWTCCKFLEDGSERWKV